MIQIQKQHVIRAQDEHVHACSRAKLPRTSIKGVLGKEPRIHAPGVSIITVTVAIVFIHQNTFIYIYREREREIYLFIYY